MQSLCTSRMRAFTVEMLRAPSGTELFVKTHRCVKQIGKKICCALEFSGPSSFQFTCKENEVKVIECNMRASWVTPSLEDLVIAGVGELVVEPPETSDLSTVLAGIEALGETLHAMTLRCLEKDWKTTKGEPCVKLAHRSPCEPNAQDSVITGIGE